MNFFDQAANVAAAPGVVFDGIHNGFYQADTQTAFAFLVDQVTKIGLIKLVDIEHRAVVDDLEDNRIAFFDKNM